MNQVPWENRREDFSDDTIQMGFTEKVVIMAGFPSSMVKMKQTRGKRTFQKQGSVLGNIQHTLPAGK